MGLKHRFELYLLYALSAGPAEQSSALDIDFSEVQRGLDPGFDFEPISDVVLMNLGLLKGATLDTQILYLPRRCNNPKQTTATFKDKET